MSTSHTSPPLDHKWIQKPVLPEWRDSLLCVFAVDLQGNASVVGTAFIISHSSDGRIAQCMSAAHVFSHVRNLQNPNPKYSRSALQEFLPRPKLIDIDPTLVRVLSHVGNRVELPIITGLNYDEESDIAFFEIKLPDSAEDNFFKKSFELSQELPNVGDEVAILSFADLSMGIDDSEVPNGEVTLKRRLVLRVGRVLAIHPTGQRLCKGACIETSIPVFSGMSGGPVIRYGTTGPMVAFGLVSSDPDLDDDRKNDTHVEGRSIVAKLPVFQQSRGSGEANVEILMPAEGGVGTLGYPND
ncbi:trypsin-like peptidase domain-containing protein [Achromobacter kerstersii]|uniref:trypsin-like peptidase domain-containing protein n=1 Tax=Achromobacter kerstersii TaxID=1353890 RepID=UPI0006C69F1B|nr:trypsin-like peptidase domain-containing protein [Achromobacter kerstersii]CUJ74877.1 Uncharacterised protein [Achromobacter kerstersii]